MPDNTFNGAAFNYAVTAGSLPPGLSLTGGSASGTTGNSPTAAIGISGTPTSGGTFNFTVTATDGNGGSSSVNYSITIFAPTAAVVTIGGRVTTGSGRGIARARISLTDGSGATRDALTNSFGYYRFADAAAGETYVLRARHKRYEFVSATQIINAAEDRADVDFTTGW